MFLALERYSNGINGLLGEVTEQCRNQPPSDFLGIFANFINSIQYGLSSLFQLITSN